MIVNKVAFKFKKDEIMNIVNQLEKVIGEIKMLKVIQYDGNLKEIAQKLNNRKEEISIEVNNAVSDIIEDIRKMEIRH